MSEEEKRRWREKQDIWEDGACIVPYRSSLDRSTGYHLPDYERPIKKGLLGIIAEVEEELRATHIVDPQSLHKIDLLRALIIEYQAAIEYARRYAVLARQLAKTAKGKRRAELEEIAEVCEWVPGNPARSFHEAVQTLWFTHVLLQLDTRGNGISPGRADQYLYPCYRRDIDEGRITKEEAIELLECLRIKMSTMRAFSIKQFLKGTSGEAQFHNVTLGGQTPDGKDATNELSYLFLEAAFRTKTPHPTLSIRCHDNMPEDFWLKALELAALGNGWPAFFNDKAHIPALMDLLNAPLEDARSYGIGGCVDPQIPGKTSTLRPMHINPPKCLELALHDGVDPRLGKQVGPKTGKFEDFSYDELVEAFKKQVSYFQHGEVDSHNRLMALLEVNLPRIFDAGLIDDCIKKGTTSIGAGPRYWYHYCNTAGMIDVACSLAAIKKCVFEDGSVSKQELMEALDANFEGYEGIRRRLLSAPKFGNDDDYVDSIAHDLYDWWQKMLSELDSLHGHKYLAAAYSISVHFQRGEYVMALPSGRSAGVALADGSVSPCQGTDFKGPTAVINSAGKVDQSHYTSHLLNIKFLPNVFKTKEDLKKLSALIKTYFDYGGKHIQFNVVDRETLLDAQVHPELHRNLLVRVAGYSAYFIELDRKVQDEILQRTAHTF